MHVTASVHGYPFSNDSYRLKYLTLFVNSSCVLEILCCKRTRKMVMFIESQLRGIKEREFEYIMEHDLRIINRNLEQC